MQHALAILTEARILQSWTHPPPRKKVRIWCRVGRADADPSSSGATPHHHNPKHLIPHSPRVDHNVYASGPTLYRSGRGLQILRTYPIPSLNEQPAHRTLHTFQT